MRRSVADAPPREPATAAPRERQARTGRPDAAPARAAALTAGTARILLPEPALVLLVGAAGAGKSTLARRWFAADEILSSDDLRALVSGDPADQAASAAAFGILYRRLDARLRAGLTTVVDATNVRRSARRPLLRRAAATGTPAVALVLDLPAEAVHAQNAARPGRVVPRDVLDRQLANLRRSLAKGQLAVEGITAVHLVQSAAALDALVVERGLVSPPRTPG